MRNLSKQIKKLSYKKQQNFITELIEVEESLNEVKLGYGCTEDQDLVNLSNHIRQKMQEIYHQPITGKNAQYIPQLKQVQPDLLCCSVCTVDGKQFTVGSDQIYFTLQSTIKPFLYLMACKEQGSKVVHRHVGREPSGQAFNSFVLNRENIPYNPMINAGAITTASLIKPYLRGQQRFNYLVNKLKESCYRTPEEKKAIKKQLKPEESYLPLKIGFDYSTFMSEKESSSRNTALAHFLNGEGVNGEHLTHDQVNQNLNLYTEACCIQTNINSAAVMAATIANGGVSPVSGLRFGEQQHANSAIQLMFSCGMYDYSGNWACTVGLPSKSGVSGLVLAVVPKVMGIAFFSPPLDELGNSTRAVEFYEWLAQEFKFNIFQALMSEKASETFEYWRVRSGYPYEYPGSDYDE